MEPSPAQVRQLVVDHIREHRDQDIAKMKASLIKEYGLREDAAALAAEAAVEKCYADLLASASPTDVA